MNVDAGLVLASLPLVVGAASGAATRDELQNSWYDSLAKPSWNPPKWVFGPVWGVLYLAMGYAMWRVYTRTAGRDGLAIGLFLIQLALNAAWSRAFFCDRDIRGAYTTIWGLVVALAATAWQFSKRDCLSGMVMAVPYLGWVLFATALNGQILSLNPYA